MMAYLARVLVLRAICHFALAQTPAEPATLSAAPSTEQITHWLNSSDPRLAAWGAKAVLDQHRGDLLKQTEETLAKAVASDPQRSGDNYAVAAMLDAVLQLDGQLPAETLQRLSTQFAAAQIALLLKLPADQARSVWRALYRPDDPEAYVGTRIAAQVLSKDPPPGFAADLFRRVTIRAHVTVRLPGSSGLGCGVAGCCGASSGGRGAEWPEIGWYHLEDWIPDRLGEPGQTTREVFSAPSAVLLVRTVGRVPGRTGCGTFARLGSRLRLDLLRQMAGDSGADLVPDPHLDIVFKDREDYHARVANLVDAQESAARQLTAGLVRRDAMTEEERQTLHLHIVLELSDDRGRDASDLPPIAFHPPVEWSPATCGPEGD